MYGGQASGIFTDSMLKLMSLGVHNGLPFSYRFFYGSSLITSARTLLANEFMESDAQYLLFIDADIGFDPVHVFELIQWQQKEGYAIVAGTYLKKNIHWDQVTHAVQHGLGSSDLPFNTGSYTVDPPIDHSSSTPVEVNHVGAGFMLIARPTFEMFKKTYPTYTYGEGRRTLYFQAEIQNDQYVSEDIFFCNMVRKFGGKVAVCPWMKLSHFGTHTYGAPQAEFIR